MREPRDFRAKIGDSVHAEEAGRVADVGRWVRKGQLIGHVAPPEPGRLVHYDQEEAMTETVPEQPQDPQPVQPEQPQPDVQPEPDEGDNA